MSMTFSRDSIADSFVLVYRRRSYSKSNIVELMNKWHSVFDSLGLVVGDSIAVNDILSPKHLSLFLAAAERGLVYAAITKMAYLFSSSYAANPETLKIKVLFEDRLSDGSNWNVTKFDMGKINEFNQSNISYSATNSTLLIRTVTSGSTGNPKIIEHCHEAIHRAASAAVQLYDSSDRVMFTNSLNHVGVITVQILPVMMVGSTAIICSNSSHVTAMERLLEYKPNKTMLFMSIVDSLKSMNMWNDVDLSFIDSVVCGGLVMTEQYVSDLFSRGVKSISNIYGMTETPPPVAIQTIHNGDDIERHFVSGFPKLGRFVSDWKYQVTNGTLWLNGNSISGSLVKDTNGFINTGDAVIQQGDDLVICGRKDNRARISDFLINLNNYERVLRLYGAEWDLRIKVCIPEVSMNQVTLTIVPSGAIPSLQRINELIIEKLGAEYQVHHLIVGKSFDDLANIKDTLRRE